MALKPDSSIQSVLNPSEHQTPNGLVTTSNVTIRYYRHPEDLECIRRMFIMNMIEISGSPYRLGLERFALPTAIATSALVLGVTALFLLSFTFSNGTAKPDSLYFSTSTLRWAAIMDSTVAATACVYFWNDRCIIRNRFQGMAKTVMETDLKDIVKSFGLRPNQENIGCVPYGSSGFWVAEGENHEIIGFVGLDGTVKKERGVGEVRRLIGANNRQMEHIGT